LLTKTFLLLIGWDSSFTGSLKEKEIASLLIHSSLADPRSQRLKWE
ncbi:5860_t:CDS:2, partial [Gigaspora rosea]